MLSRRAADLDAPIQMCDALSRNVPAELQTILANCLAHGRRQFVDVADRFPQECRHVLEAIAVIYRNDALARQQDLSPEARLEFHQADSGPTMAELHAWLGRQFEERLVEPNSALGEAISYLLKHWEKLTLFLRVPGAPLDNNICERILKKAILHRKNALFYKTCRGAHVGDIFMSLIHTAELGGADAFDLPDRTGTPCEGCRRESPGLDALELPADLGQHRRVSRRPLIIGHSLPSLTAGDQRFFTAAARTRFPYQKESRHDNESS